MKFVPTLALIASLVFIGALAGCGEATSTALAPASTACAAGVAQVDVFDGFLRNGCGCTEAAGTVATPPASLDCTVTAGTLVVFQYLGTVLKHQIVPTGTTSVFAASPLSDPAHAPPVVRTHAVQLATPGNYPFQDALNSALSGTLHVL